MNLLRCHRGAHLPYSGFLEFLLVGDEDFSRIVTSCSASEFCVFLGFKQFILHAHVLNLPYCSDSGQRFIVVLDPFGENFVASKYQQMRLVAYVLGPASIIELTIDIV